MKLPCTDWHSSCAVSTASNPPWHLAAVSDTREPLVVPGLDPQEWGRTRTGVTAGHTCAEVTPVTGEVEVRMRLLGGGPQKGTPTQEGQDRAALRQLFGSQSEFA